MKMLKYIVISLMLVLSLVSVSAAPQPGLCYFGDSNGDCVITRVDADQAKLSANLKIGDYSGVTPSSPDVQDVNGDGVVTISDYNLIKGMISLKSSGLTGVPANVMIIQAPSQLDITAPTDIIKIRVVDVDGTPRAGIGVLFTIDGTSTATANLGGRDPSNGDNYIPNSNSVFELTNKISQGGEAQIAITPLTTGTLIVNIVIPANPSKGLPNDITKSITINVVNGGSSIVNQAPVFDPINLNVNGAIYSNQLIQFTVSATDADGDPLVYSLVSGPGLFNAATQTYTWTPTQADKTATFTSYTLTFGVTDTKATTETSVPIILVNRVPVIQNLVDVVLDENGLVSIIPVTTDDDGDVLTLTYSIPLNSNGQWQTDYNSAGAFVITVIASDGVSATSKTFNLNVNDVAQNTGGDSGGGNSGGSNSQHDYSNVEPAQPAVPAIPTVEEATPAVPAQISNENVQTNGNQITGFSVVDTIKQNPITTTVALVIVLGILAYGFYFFKK